METGKTIKIPKNKRNKKKPKNSNITYHSDSIISKFVCKYYL